MSTPPRALLLSIVLLTGCGGGGGGGGGGPTDPPAAPTAFVQQAGISRAAAGSGTVRIDFVAPAAGFEAAAFVSTNPASLFGSTPRVPGGGQTRVNVSGLANGMVHYLGLGIRPSGGGAYSPSGPVVTATPRAPIYVDAAAAPGGNGSSPATAFDRLPSGVSAAQTAGGGNVWVKGGSYALTQNLLVVSGVHVYGGFGAAFDLASRDPDATPTVLGAPSGIALTLGDKLGNSLAVVLDGFRLEGNGRGLVGIDVDSTDPCRIELRSVAVSSMRDRGIRVRNANDDEFELVMTSSASSGNGADGLSGSGAYDYTVFNSQFGGNGQEGMELDGLVPETGTKVTLDVESCQFFANMAEGLDCALRTPLSPTSGEFSVRIRACAFEGNRQSGCVVDSDFEAASGYSANVVVRESMARANGGDGFLLDLDGPLDTSQDLTAYVYRVLANGNAGNGLHVTSEIRPGLLAVSTSAFLGNTGAGLRAEGQASSAGNRAVVATHCLFAGNTAGGLVSRDLPATASSSIAYQQSNAFSANTTQVRNVGTNDPAAIAFRNAPEEYRRVLSRSASSLSLATPSTFTSAAVVELADDTVLRSVSSITSGGTVVTLTDEPLNFTAPGLLAAFRAGTTDVTEDYRLLGGSLATAAGMNGSDAGPFGSAASGTPGQADPINRPVFHVVGTSPALSQTVAAGATITITFSNVLRGNSANATTVRAFRGSSPINVTLGTSGPRLTVAPAGGNWGAGDFRIELDGLVDSAGNELSGAVSLPISR